MTVLTIRELDARYRLPARGMRSRLDAAMRVMLDGALDAAVARLDLPADGILCVRSVFVPVRLAVSDPLDSLAEAWAEAFAAALAEVVRGGRAAGAVWYASRAEVLLDFAAGIASGERGREWAWRQALEHDADTPLSESAAVRAWVDGVCADAPGLIPILVTLARRGLLERLFPRLHGEQVRRLAEVAAGGRLAAVGVETPLGTAQRPVGAARRVARESVILRAYRRSRVNTDPVPPAVAVLAVVEVEPGATASERVFRELVRAVQSVPHTASVDPIPAERESRGVDGVAPERAAESVAGGPAEESATIRSPVDRPAESPELGDARVRAWTDHGGLLYLLNLMGPLEIPPRLVEELSRTERPLAWGLHRLALRLAPDAADDDPAVLAFAGLVPTVAPPDGDPPGEAEEGAVAAAAESIRAVLAGLFEDEPDALMFVCRRRAEVVADRGWFEVRFVPEAVSAAVRRTGLDRDPGHVPWLGVVVKFVYG